MSGIECYQLNLTPLPEADPDDLAALFQADALIITLPASRTVKGADNHFLAVQQVVDSALAGMAEPGRYPGRFLEGKQGLLGGGQGVNLVHLADVISAITLLLQLPAEVIATIYDARRDIPPSMVITRRWRAR